MIKSIRHFEEISTGVFEKVIGEFYRNPTDFASFTRGITEELYTVGRILIRETLEEMDKMLRNSGKRKQDWVIEQHPSKQLVTILGTVDFRKTFFTNKKTGETECLLDRILGLEKNEPEAPKSERHRLIHPHYFSRTAEGCSNEELWDEVYRYMDATYELEKVKKIYLNSDGGGWIKSGIRQIGGAVHVLDRFHLEKHLTKLTGHMKDSAGEVRSELYRVICKGKKRNSCRSSGN